jgi:hypothetical protein
MKLDAKTIAGLELADDEDEKFLWDEDLSGFGVRLRRAKGNRNRIIRTWVAQYRAHGRTRRPTIGSVEKLSPGEARTAAKKTLAMVALGGDPQGDKVAERLQATRTLRWAIVEYLAAKKSELRPASYRVTELYLLRGSYFKPLHITAITEITHPDVAARLTAIKRAHSNATAAQARRALSAFFTWAMGEGLMGRNPVNPIIGTNKPIDPEPRDRVLTDAELTAVWRASGRDDFGTITKLLVLTGCRRQEVGSMAWSEIDFEKGTWTMPSGRTKNGRMHTLPLPKGA